MEFFFRLKPNRDQVSFFPPTPHVPFCTIKSKPKEHEPDKEEKKNQSWALTFSTYIYYKKPGVHQQFKFSL